MSTPLNISRPTHVRRSKYQSAVDWILDVDGDMYGDERERLRWYEGIAISASVQWILIPWMLAIMAWICSKETVPYLWVVWIVTTIPQYVAIFYVSRTRVNVYNFTWTRKRVLITALTIVPLLIFLVGVGFRHDFPSGGGSPSWSTLAGAAVGALCGGALLGVLVRLKKRSDAAHLEALDSAGDDE